MSAKLNFDPACHSALKAAPRIAVAVSGGADSMALAHALHTQYPNRLLFAYTVDHGLRAGSPEEARRVAAWVAPFATHRILTWDGHKPENGIQEAARAARYRLLHEAARGDAVDLVCLAHHRDDQAETLLHRLAKGSGLDGLTGMQAVTRCDDITHLRPLLCHSHDELIAYCRAHGMEWIEDPSNDNPLYARVRLRQAREALEAEGLTNERLVKLAQRLSRAREALDFYTENAWQEYDGTISGQARLELPPEIILRLVLKLADLRAPDHSLRSRLGPLEELLNDRTPRRVTLGRTILTFHEDGGIDLEAESKA